MKKINHINHTNINVDKAFNNYIKRTFNGLSAYTLSQVLADFMRTGWETDYFFSEDDDWNRWNYLHGFTTNNVITMQFDKYFVALSAISQSPMFDLCISDTAFKHLASFLVQEDLFLAFTRRNNPDLIEVIADIVRTCPYL